MNDISTLCQNLVQAIVEFLSPNMSGGVNPNIQIKNAQNKIVKFGEHPRKYFIPCKSVKISKLVFIDALMRIVMNDRVNMHYRQFACIQMKNYIRQGWVRVTDKVQSGVRNNILKGLAIQNSKVVTGVSLVVAEIAHTDFPEKWPNLITQLIDMFTNNRGNKYMRYGSVKCLSFVSEHFAEQHVVKLMPLVQFMIQNAANKNNEENLRTRCVYTIENVMIPLAYLLESNMGNQLFGQIRENLIKFIVMFASETDSSRMTCRFKIGVYKLLLTIVTTFSHVLPPNILGKLFTIQIDSLKKEYQVFANKYIQQNADDDGNDSEGNSINLKTLIHQMLEVLVSTITSYSFSDILQRQHMVALCDAVFPFLQLRQEHLELWNCDPNTFIDRTDDSSSNWNIRKMVIYIFHELGDFYDEDGLKVIVEVFFKYFRSASNMFSQKKNDWWRVRECSIYAAEGILEKVEDIKVAKRINLDIPNIIKSLFQIDLSQKVSPPFLQARAVSFIGSTISFQNQQIASQLFDFVYPKIKDRCFPLKIAAARTCTKYIKYQKELGINRNVFEGKVKGLIEGVCNIMQQSSSETLYITLECLHCCVHFEPKAISGNVGKNILNNLFAMYYKYHFEPVNVYELQDCFQAFTLNQDAQVHMMNVLFMKAMEYIKTFGKQNVVVVSKMLEFVNIVLQGENLNQNDGARLIQNSFVAVLNLASTCLEHDMHYEIIQNITEYFRFIIHVNPEYVFKTTISWRRQNNVSPMQLILNVFVVKMLQLPVKDDGSCLEMGKLVSSIIQFYGNFLIQKNILPTLLRGLVNRLPMSKHVPFVQSIIMVFVRLFAKGDKKLSSTIIDFLHSFKMNDNQLGELKTKMNGQNSGLALVFHLWSQYDGVFKGFLERKYSAVALLNLLTSESIQKLSSVSVPHQFPDLLVQTRGPVTRSRTKKLGGNVPGVRNVPFPLRGFSLLVGTLQYEISIKKESEKRNNVLIQSLMKGIPQNIGKAGKEFSDDDYLYITNLMTMEGEEEDAMLDRFEKNSNIVKMKLVENLVNGIRKLCNMNRQYYDQGMKILGPKGKKILQALMNNK